MLSLTCLFTLNLREVTVHGPSRNHLGRLPLARYSRRSDWGSGPAGGLGLLVLILVVVLLLRATNVLVI